MAGADSRVRGGSAIARAGIDREADWGRRPCLGRAHRGDGPAICTGTAPSFDARRPEADDYQKWRARPMFTMMSFRASASSVPNRPLKRVT